MSAAALVLTYHAIARGPAPLFIEPDLFADHLDRIAASGATVLTVCDLAAALRSGTLPDRVVALTFDDGFADVAETAAQLLAERGLPATMFCVADHVGGVSDWATQPPSAPRLPLAGAGTLTALVAAGWEIGSHGATHAPLSRLTRDLRRHELERSRSRLEELLGEPIRSFAYPYGAVPDTGTQELRAAGYDAGCTTYVALATSTTSPFAISRVDAHYLRRGAQLTAVLEGRAPGYLAARRLAARVRRVVTTDYEQ